RRSPERAEEITEHRGEERVWLSHKFPLRLPSGEWALGGVSVDITGLKRTERELRETSVRVKVAFEAARMAAWTWDRATRTFHAPEGMGHVFGVAEPGVWTNEQLL